MNTPICDFIDKYIKASPLRLHMPGHKGVAFTGAEASDITEIHGADSLYSANGIIKQSEVNASKLFGCETFYSTEGSSHCIRAMLYLVTLYAKESGVPPVIAAGRNAHKVFVNTAALLDFDVQWINGGESYLSCGITADGLDAFLSDVKQKPVAVYLTSPDYLGNVADISSLSKVCHRHNILLLADNAHGAYLKFLNPSQHPIDKGADMCCDSAHKTLPVLTGGAYLHIGRSASGLFSKYAKEALELFGSTSPSYLILKSLDMANKYIFDGYCEKLEKFVQKVSLLKEKLEHKGFCLYGNEPLKITLCPKKIGYTGNELADILEREHKIICEFADPDFVVFMLTLQVGEEGIEKLRTVLSHIPLKGAIEEKPPKTPICKRVMSPKAAVFSQKEELPVENCLGRVLASAGVSCPPAVPIVICGEEIDKNSIESFKYYGIETCTVVKTE